MKRTIIKIRDFVTLRKIWMMRATGYMALVNTILIVLVYLKVDNNPILVKFSIPIIFGWIVTLVFLGWLETEKLKTPHFEAEKMLKLNPPLEFIYNKVKEIDERIKRMEARSLNEM